MKTIGNTITPTVIQNPTVNIAHIPGDNGRWSLFGRSWFIISLIQIPHYHKCYSDESQARRSGLILT
jgi:hypothetical protein